MIYVNRIFVCSFDFLNELELLIGVAVLEDLAQNFCGPRRVALFILQISFSEDIAILCLIDDLLHQRHDSVKSN